MSNNSYRIIVVEDDDRIAINLARSLVAEGYGVERGATIAEGRTLLNTGADLVLLDVGLPDGDGVEFCRELQTSHPGLAVILLTARGEEIDVVVGFDAGAIDYVSKPFRLAELLARIRSQLRRTERVDTKNPAAVDSDRLVAGDVTVDRMAHRVWVGGTEVELRAKEFELLAELVANPGAVIKREDLMSRVWDENWWGSTKTLDVHIGALRRRLGEDSPTVSRIVSLRGIGYRFEPRSPD